MVKSETILSQEIDRLDAIREVLEGAIQTRRTNMAEDERRLAEILKELNALMEDREDLRKVHRIRREALRTVRRILGDWRDAGWIV